MTPNGQVTALWHADEWLYGPLLQAPDGRLWGSTRRGRPFVLSLAGGDHLIETDSRVVVHTIAADGTMHGFQRPDNFREDDAIVKVLPTGEVRRYGPVGFGPDSLVSLFVGGSLVDGRDGFLYGTSSGGTAADALGAIFRIPGPGPSPPPNVRIVR